MTITIVVAGSPYTVVDETLTPAQRENPESLFVTARVEVEAIPGRRCFVNPRLASAVYVEHVWRDLWPNREEAKEAGCTCTWVSGAIVSFAATCPIRGQHREADDA